jgi:crotonobetaine/carnitine-CoA ligase
MSERMPADELAELRKWRVVPERLAYWARQRPDDRFIRCGDRWWSFAQFADQVEAVAAGLTHEGVTKGDRVAIILPNCEQYVIAIFALARLGAIQVPLNVYLRGEFLRYQLADSQASVLIADPAGIQEAREQRHQLDGLRTMVSVGECTDADVVPWDSLLSHGNDAPEVSIRPSDVLAIMYTSGTTGMPKGCMLSHGYYTSISWGWYGSDWYRPGDVVVSAMPLFHIGGQGGALVSALMGGISIEILSSFSASGMLSRVRDAGATVLFGVGAMALAMLAAEPRVNDREHRLRTAIFPGGPAIPPPAQQGWRDRFGTEIICEGYGQSECVPITMSPSGAQRGTSGCLGKPVPHLEVALLDEDNCPVPVGEVGEIAVRPREPYVTFSGYWGKPEATQQAWRGLWHHTGDSARMDSDGVLTYVGRLSDSLRRSGENISAVELESAILTHPDIAAAAVHGVPSEFGDDDVKAWIVLTPGTELTPEALHAFLVTAVPYFAVPRYVHITDKLPTNALGRVQKFILKDLGNEGAWDFLELGLAIAVTDRRRRSDASKANVAR